MKSRFALLMAALFVTSFVFGAGSALFTYASGKEVAYSPYMSMVSHTEYRFSEPGQIIARLVDFQGAPVAVNNCTTRILYPDKTIFVSAALMTASANITGDYYYSFTTPAGPEGTYEYQATCTYASGTKTASVTNSFHLSSAFTSVLGNISAVNNNVLAVQGNLTALSSQVSAVNASLAGQITDLSAQLNANTTQVLNAITAVNGSIYSALQNLTVNVNLTPVLNAISNLDAAMAANFTYTNGLITGVNASTQASFSVVTSQLDAMNVTLNANNAYLVLINATTVSTYDYVTGTLTTKVDSVLTDLGVINATVNRIETLSTAINSTVSTILENQQNAVVMTVTSG